MYFFRKPIQHDSEDIEVKKFLNNSYHFRKLKELYFKHQSTNLCGIVTLVQGLEKDTSFQRMQYRLSRFDPYDMEDAATYFELKVVPYIARTIVFFGAFVNDNANIAYYATNLHEEVVNKMVELGVGKRPVHEFA